VLTAQLRDQEPLRADEQALAVRFDTERLTEPELRVLAHALVEPRGGTDARDRSG
jgi:hypothetical protein